MKRHVKQGDKVIVISGKYRRFIGKVEVIIKERAFLQNYPGKVIRRWKNPQSTDKGAVINIPSSIHLSNLKKIP